MTRKMKMAFVAIMHISLPRWLRLLLLIGCFCMVGACLTTETGRSPTRRKKLRSALL